MSTPEYFAAMDGVIDDAAALGKKIGRLKDYLESSPAAPADFVELLTAQLEAMRAYEVILVKRISNYVGIPIPSAQTIST